MSRSSRPSDLLRPGVDTVGGAREAVAYESPPRRRWSRPVAVGVGFLAFLAVLGLVLSDDGEQPAPDPRLRREAAAALGLYEAEAAVAVTLRQRRDIFAAPGPYDAGVVAGDALARLRRRLRQARSTAGGGAAAPFVNDRGHRAFGDHLADLQVLAFGIARVEAAHESLFGDDEAPDRSTASQLLRGSSARGSQDRALDEWTDSLATELIVGDAQDEAIAARSAVRDHWAAEVSELIPPVEGALFSYVEQLPDEIVAALREERIAGPALSRLPLDSGP